MEKRTLVVVLLEQGLSYHAAGTQLGICHKTVFILVHNRQTGSVDDKPRSGRPKVTTERQDRVFVRLSLQDCRLTGPELRAEMEGEHRVQLSAGQGTRDYSRQGYGAV